MAVDLIFLPHGENHVDNTIHHMCGFCTNNAKTVLQSSHFFTLPQAQAGRDSASNHIINICTQY